MRSRVSSGSGRISSGALGERPKYSGSLDLIVSLSAA